MNLADDTRCSNCHQNIMAGTVVEIDRPMALWKCPSCEDWNRAKIDEVVKLTKKKKKNPILNPDSKHYAMFDGFESVERMEQMYTKEDLMAWAKITAMKYRLRIGNKDDVVKEAEKIKTYEDYYAYLEEQLEEEINGD